MKYIHSIAVRCPRIHSDSKGRNFEENNDSAAVFRNCCHMSKNVHGDHKLVLEMITRRVIDVTDLGRIFSILYI